MEQPRSRDRREAAALLGYVVVAAPLALVPVLLQAGTTCFETDPDQARLCSDAGLTALTLWLGVTVVALTVGLVWLMLVLRHGRSRVGPVRSAARGPAVVLGLVVVAHVVMCIVLG